MVYSWLLIALSLGVCSISVLLLGIQLRLAGLEGVCRLEIDGVSFGKTSVLAKWFAPVLHWPLTCPETVDSGIPRPGYISLQELAQARLPFAFGLGRMAKVLAGLSEE